MSVQVCFIRRYNGTCSGPAHHGSRLSSTSQVFVRLFELRFVVLVVRRPGPGGPSSRGPGSGGPGRPGGPGASVLPQPPAEVQQPVPQLLVLAPQVL